MVEALTRNKKAVEVPAKDARPIDRLIKRGITLKTRLAVTKVAIEATNEKLLPYCEELAMSTGLKSATFRGTQGQVVAKFSEGILYESKDIPKIKEILGPLYTTAFHEVPSFSFNPADLPEIKKLLGKDFSRLFHMQLNVSHTDELKKLLVDGDSETSKKLRDYVSIESKKPSFSYEKTAG